MSLFIRVLLSVPKWKYPYISSCREKTGFYQVIFFADSCEQTTYTSSLTSL